LLYLSQIVGYIDLAQDREHRYEFVKKATNVVTFDVLIAVNIKGAPF
jgi:hypothetical protein